MRLTLPCYPVCQPAKILLSRVSRVRVRARVRVRVTLTLTLSLTLTLELLANKILTPVGARAGTSPGCAKKLFIFLLKFQI